MTDFLHIQIICDNYTVKDGKRNVVQEMLLRGSTNVATIIVNDLVRRSYENIGKYRNLYKHGHLFLNELLGRLFFINNL